MELFLHLFFSSAKFFSSGCAPGAEPNSPFCSLCVGSGKAVGDQAKCKASADEKYYGYAGAFRYSKKQNGIAYKFVYKEKVSKETGSRGKQSCSILPATVMFFFLIYFFCKQPRMCQELKHVFLLKPELFNRF